MSEFNFGFYLAFYRWDGRTRTKERYTTAITERADVVLSWHDRMAATAGISNCSIHYSRGTREDGYGKHWPIVDADELRRHSIEDIYEVDARQNDSRYIVGCVIVLLVVACILIGAIAGS